MLEDAALTWDPPRLFYASTRTNALITGFTVPGWERLHMMTLGAAAVAAMLAQSEFRLVNADTSSPAIGDETMRPTLNSSEVAAVQYRQDLLALPRNAGTLVCRRSSAAGGTTCVVNSLPAFPLP